MKKFITKSLDWVAIKSTDSKMKKLFKMYVFLGLFALASIIQFSFIFALSSILKTFGFSAISIMVITTVSCILILGFILNEFLSN